MYNNKQRIPTQVVGQIAKANFRLSQHDADAVQEQSTGPLSLDAKDMLHPGTNLCPGTIALIFPVCQLFVSTTLALNMLPVAHLLQICYPHRERYAESAQMSRLVFSGSSNSSKTLLSYTSALLTVYLYASSSRFGPLFQIPAETENSRNEGPWGDRR